MSVLLAGEQRLPFQFDRLKYSGKDGKNLMIHLKLLNSTVVFINYRLKYVQFVCIYN